MNKGRLVLHTWFKNVANPWKITLEFFKENESLELNPKTWMVVLVRTCTSPCCDNLKKIKCAVASTFEIDFQRNLLCPLRNKLKFCWLAMCIFNNVCILHNFFLINIFKVLKPLVLTVQPIVPKWGTWMWVELGLGWVNSGTRLKIVKFDKVL